MSRIRCAYCQRSPENTVLYRINEKGAPGKWVCMEHANFPLDPAVKRVVDIVSGIRGEGP